MNDMTRIATRRKRFYTLKINKKGELYRYPVKGVEFEIERAPIRAYISEEIHTMYFLVPETGTSFCSVKLPFVSQFNEEDFLEHAPEYIEKKYLIGYLRFFREGGSQKELEKYKALKRIFESAKAVSVER